MPVIDALSVLMKFEIKTNLRGCVVKSENINLTYTPKLFSMSGVLSDENGKTLVTMKRTKWWHYSFDITTPVGSYILTRNWGTTKLVSLTENVEFDTTGTTEFYIKGSKRVTKLELIKWFMNTFSLEIVSIEHWHALLIASCFIHKLDIQGNGA